MADVLKFPPKLPPVTCRGWSAALARSTATLHCPTTILAMATRWARETLTAEIRSRGVRVTTYRASDITFMADEWLEDHPELIERAAETIQRSPFLRKLAEREARDRQRRAIQKTPS